MTIPISCENCQQVINFLNDPEIVGQKDVWFCNADCQTKFQDRQVNQTVAAINTLLRRRANDTRNI